MTLIAIATMLATRRHLPKVPVPRGRIWPTPAPRQQDHLRARSINAELKFDETPKSVRCNIRERACRWIGGAL